MADGSPTIDAPPLIAKDPDRIANYFPSATLGYGGEVEVLGYGGSAAVYVQFGSQEWYSLDAVCAELKGYFGGAFEGVKGAKGFRNFLGPRFLSRIVANAGAGPQASFQVAPESIPSVFDATAYEPQSFSETQIGFVGISWPQESLFSNPDQSWSLSVSPSLGFGARTGQQIKVCLTPSDLRKALGSVEANLHDLLRPLLMPPAKPSDWLTGY